MNISDKEKTRLLTRYGDWALVTGASSGIGLELARQLARAGLHLVLNARNAEKLLEVERELTAYGVQIKTVAADLGQSAGVERLIQSCEGLPIGLLVNNAGYGLSGLFVDSSLPAQRDMLRVNCEAVMVLSHYFAQKFKQRGRGGMVFLSSLVAFQGVPYAAHYAATKAYVQSLAEGLAAELRPLGIDVLSAAPGPVDSGFAQRADMNMGKNPLPEQIALPILRALGRRLHVVPGAKSKFLTYSLRLAPRSIRVAILHKIMSGFTRHQRE